MADRTMPPTCSVPAVPKWDNRSDRAVKPAMSANMVTASLVRGLPAATVGSLAVTGR